MNGRFWSCTREEYDAEPALRSSELKDFRVSRKTYEWRYVLGKMPPREQSEEMVLGTMFHAYTLEGEIQWTIAGKCEGVLKSGDRKGEECGHNTKGVDDDGKWLCGTHSKGKDLTMPANAITEQQRDHIDGMYVELRNSEHRHLLEDIYEEHAVRWTDAKTGIECKALLDMLGHTGKITDLKTTQEFNAESLWRKIERLGWGFSLAFYELGLRHIDGFNHEVPWSLLIVESVPPYRVQEFHIPQEYQDICRSDVRQELNGLKECRESGEYKEKPLEFGMPAWVGFARENRGSAR